MVTVHVTATNTSNICGAQAGSGYFSSAQQPHELGVNFTGEEIQDQKGEVTSRSHCCW